MRLKRLSIGSLLAVCLAACGCAGMARSAPLVEGMKEPTLLDRMLGRGPQFHYQQPIAEVPSELKNPAQLSLRYARLMEDQGNLQEAQTHYGKVLEAKPENVEAVVGLARVHQLSGRTDEAEQMYHKALRVDAQSPLALHGMGQFYASQKRWHEAAELLNKAVVEAPTERAYRYDLAVSLVHTGNVDAALPHFIRTVGDAEAHYNIGLILHQQGRLQESAGQFRMALAKKPDLQQAQYWLDVVMREGTPAANRPAVTSGQRNATPAGPSTTAAPAASHGLSLAMHP